MADKNSGWSCATSASIISQTNTEATIRVFCYWRTGGWTYDINNVSAWVYLNGSDHQVMSSGSVDAPSHNTSYQLGYYDYKVSKTTNKQSIPYCAKITSSSSYVSGTKWSGDQYIEVAAKPSYTVSYNANGGTGAPGNQTKWYGTNITLSSTKPTRTGHTFVRWNGGSHGYYAPGSVYSGNADMTLTAEWKANTYTVSYNANGGSGAPGNQTKTYGVNLTLSSTKPTRTNYIFKGWSTSANGGVVYASGATYTTNAAVTLYAVWELGYTKPRITNFTANRCTSNGTISETGTYIKVSFNWATDKTMHWINVDWKAQTASNWTVEGAVSQGGGTSGTITKIVGGGNINTETSYYVRIYVEDEVSSTLSHQISVGTVAFPIDVKAGGKGIAFGKVAETNNLFDVGFPSRFREKVTFDNNNPINIYKTGIKQNGTWLLIGTFIFDGQGDTAAIDCYCGDGQNGNHTQNTHFKIILKQGWTGETNPIGITTNFTQNYANTSRIRVTIHHDSQTQCKLYIYGGFSYNDLTCDITGSYNSFIPSFTVIDPNTVGEVKESAYYYNGGCTLYDNSSGTTGTVTLTESAGLFNYIEILCARDTWHYSTGKIPSPNGKTVALTTTQRYNSENVYLYTKHIVISGTSITSSYAHLTDLKSYSGADNNHKIIKVIGYR